ncbi:MAG: hypothetical protein PHS07_02565 [Patescibacteria group bacterium]|jgi:hypothetical protein|nr:hypothetical protein [Patescibacteria group bacterium]
MTLELSYNKEKMFKFIQKVWWKFNRPSDSRLILKYGLTWKNYQSYN